MAKRLRDIKDKVYKILEQHPKARDNDGTLIAHFLFEHSNQFVREDMDGELVIRMKDFQNLPPFNSVSRARRIIQNDDGLFLPTSAAVRKARRIKEDSYRNWEVREAQNHQFGNVKTENGMQTMESKSKSDPSEYHTTRRTPQGKYICNCKGAQYGHECVHIKKLKELNAAKEEHYANRI